MNSQLYNSLKKYGISEFQVVIFVTLDRDQESMLLRGSLRMLEQWFFDELKPSLNILTVAGSSLGYQHRAESKNKMRVNHHNRIEVQVTDILRDSVDVYLSLREAAVALKTSTYGIRYTLKHGTIFRGRYKIIKLNK